jgi:DNA repair protein RecO (recombination protein O)
VAAASRVARSRAAATRVEDDALLLRRVAFGEADVIATFFTPSRGVVATVARGARKSSRRFTALEPMHVLRVAFDERPDAELAALREASIARPRSALTGMGGDAGALGRIEAAGRCLRWVRRGLSPHVVEREVWRELEAVLDALDDPLFDAQAAEARAAAFGLRLLADLGWGLELARCAVCGKPCDPAASAYVDASRGGIVCRACGGGALGDLGAAAAQRAGGATPPARVAIVLRAPRRAALAAAAAGDDAALADPEDVAVAVQLVDAALAAHTT